MPNKDPKTGKFVVGGGGPGRPKGARNKLTEFFLEKVFQDFQKHGVNALERLRNEDVASYVRAITAIIEKAPQAVTLTGEEGGPVNLNIKLQDLTNRIASIAARAAETADFTGTEDGDFTQSRMVDGHRMLS